LKVIGIGVHIYYYGSGRIPLFKVTQIFTDGITDEIDTGDISFMPEPKKLPVLE
jgi:hypothetical protein